MPSVLIVEDNEADVFLIQEAIENAGLAVSLHVVKDGEQAGRFFELADQDLTIPCPALVILDINLPKKQGSEVLKQMRQSSRFGNASVLVVSTSESARDREQMDKLGADRYFRKPSGYDQFMQLGEIVKTLLLPPLPQ